MAGRFPEESVRTPLIRQRWHSIAFLHWSYEPSEIARLLPDGLEPDVFDGRAWVSLTPFLAQDTRAAVGPPLPVGSTFPETNLRTYVVGPDGRDGIWFFTLEVGNPLLPLATRPTIGVPYRWANMSVSEGATVAYRSRRAGACGVGHDIEIVPGDERAPSALEDFLTGRWLAYSVSPAGLVAVAVEHEPWTLHDVTVMRLDETLRADAGLADGTDAELVQWSRGVNARLGNPRLVRKHPYSRAGERGVPALDRS